MPNTIDETCIPPGPLIPHTDGCFPGNHIRSESLSISHRESLPVWTMDYAIYSVVLHLSDSIPSTERAQWMELRKSLTDLARKNSRELTPDEVSLLREAYTERIEKYLSSGCGECLLRNENASAALAATLEHDNGSIYALHAWMIMPNHLHVILQLADGQKLSKVLNDWKRISAHGINHAAGRHGDVWMDGAYTRIIRTADEYRMQLSYLWNNADAAGLKSGFLRRRYVQWGGM